MSTQLLINGFVLAGGKSLRLGRDKALLDWHGRTLLEHMVDLLASATDHVRVVGRDPVPDLVPGRGPLSGILTALETSETDSNIVVAVDLPLLTKQFLKYLKSRAVINSRQIVACKIGSDFPLCMAFRRNLLPELWDRMRRGDLSVHTAVENCDAEVISELELKKEGFDLSIFKNINTQRDYLEALRQ